MSSKTKAGKKAPEKGKTTAEPSSSSESKSAAAETTSATESKTAKPETSSENKTPDKAGRKIGLGAANQLFFQRLDRRIPLRLG